MSRRRPDHGVTLVELLVGFSIFALLMALLAAAVSTSRKIWERASGSSSSQLELRRSFAPLVQDLSRTEFATVRVADGPISLTGKDGDALWFLSAVDPESGEVVRTADGRPLWQRNILYYSVVPNQHQSLHGFLCTGASDSRGYEVQCPHKILVRKVIDNPPATLPDTAPEEILSDVTPYLTRPDGHTPSGLAQPGLEDVSFKSTALVTFAVELEPNLDWPGEVRIGISSARLEEARRAIRIGSASLEPFLNRLSFSVFPPRSQAAAP